MAIRCFPLVIVTLLSSAAPILAADWPHGPARDGHAKLDGPAPAKLGAAKVVWKRELGFGLSSPVVAGERVFILDEQDGKEVLQALGAADGKPLWSAVLDDTFKDSQSQPGPRATPAVDGERIFSQSSRGKLKCLNTADGKIIWETDFVADLGAVFTGEKGPAEGATRHGYTPCPLVDGDRLIALAGGKGAAVVCFDKATGKIIWKSQDDTPAYAAPIIAEIAGRRQLIAFMVQGVIALDPADGKLLWRVPLKTNFGRHVTTPIVSGDMVLVASHQIGLIGIRVTKKGDGFDAETAYTNKDAAFNFSSPVAVGQHMYGVGPAKNLVCVEMATGKIAWSQDGLFSTAASKTHAGIIVLGDKLLILTDTGQLILAAADPKAYRDLGKAQACGQNWCIPAYAGGRLYVRDAKEIRCLELSGG